MKELPQTARSYRRTAEFTQSSVPQGLLQAHRTRAGVWGRIVVVQGALTYRILEPALEEHCLDPECSGVIEPTVRHEVVPGPGVRFYVEFYRVESYPEGDESTD